MSPSCCGPRWPQRRRRRLLSDVVWEPARAPTERERERGLAAALAPRTGEPPGPARTLGADALAQVRHTRVVSAGALERYGDCPVRWLVESQLSPRRLAPDEEPLVRGSLIHELLEGLLAELGEAVSERSLPRALEILQRQMGQLGGRARALGAGEPPVVRAGALRAIEAALRRYLEHEAATSEGWRPVALERRFGFDEAEGSLPPLALGDGPEPVLVRGAIDRIDVDRAGRALVRDYKSGAPRADWPAARWKPDRRVQVALYMLVVRELEQLDVIAGNYQPLRGDDLRARGVFADEVDAAAGFHAGDMRSREELDEELADAAARAVELAHGCAPGTSSRVRRRAHVTAARIRRSAAANDRGAGRSDAAGEFGEPVARRWTDEQLAAIERRHGDLLLDAGAGSGKTSVLVERFARTVIEDGVDVSAILVITFTEKAAAELRDRIRLRLRELGALDAARATEGAFISTIHGFCARVLRAGALAAGLDPEFEVLDELRSGRLSAVAFERALTSVAARDGRLVDLIAAYGAGPLRAATAGVYEQLRSAGELSPRLPAVDVPADDGSARLTAAASAVAAELSAIADPGTRVLEGIDKAARRDRDSAAGRGRRLAGLALASEAAQRCRGAVDRRLRRVSRGAGRVPRGRRRRASVDVRDVLDRLLVAYAAEYARAKRDVSGLDFEDLELGARELLASDDALRERYAERFAAIMVDELQDTNAVQLSLIESIAHDNLFTVGDAQQSIYGFRHADVELFSARGRRLEQAGARLTLATNFRSRPEILDAINHGFRDALGDEFIVLRPGRAPEPPAGDALTELLLVDKGADWELEGMASPWRLAEARALARRVGELVAAGTAPGEIVVLLRAMTDVRVYERALEQHGLPTYVIGGRGYWDHPQIVDLVCYLRALDNPLDEEAFYGVLGSPLVGASLDALVLISAAVRDTGSDPWSVVRADADSLPALGADDRARLRTFAGWFVAERAGWRAAPSTS